MSTAKVTVASAINQALHSVMEEDERVLIVGEDLLDPYGGAFKLTKGLSTRWRERVLATPISEAGFIGACGGMALRGLRPVAEIMFGDFLALTFDQLLNHLSKYWLMFDGKVSCPMVVRTPMGGRRGYGATHSQCLEKYFVGIPGLTVLAISPFHDIPAFYRQAILECQGPVLLIEDKVGYSQLWQPFNGTGVADFSARLVAARTQAIAFSANDFSHTDVTLVTYGGMASMALEAARQLLFEQEVFVEVIVIGQLAPFDLEDVREAVSRSGRVVVAEEGTRRAGVGAELAAHITENCWKELKGPVLRVAALDYVVPSTKVLEDAVLPGLNDLKSALQAALNH